MKFSLKNPIVLMLLCLMTGIIITVSFLETPLKFQVPGMTLSIALGLGKMMFGISTAIQSIFLILILILMLIFHKSYATFDFVIIGILIFILALEKFWMLPVLDARIDWLSSGKALSPTPLHDYFIYAETAKLVTLFLTIILQFKKTI
ncbi:hypothetical protein EG347_00750 [Chryseobacterium sp. G0186]|uniref:hypothetical protein n=1 Tax=Chryseobacterium sp. G0186 TaxID=2487064 RepID=UPI000F4F8A9C|nr:hypothetical protein [Chryseobacterium sp. G0186]AZA76159.1 hypothetical protein EG347_00750 [Chryseobacterium sp. G0186]